MARTYSQEIALGSEASPFSLPATDGRRYSLRDFAEARVLAVVFTCNHCPYAQHVEDTIIRLARGYEGEGVQFVAISSNDAQAYPEDSFDSMRDRATEKGYTFPYLYDESQEVARAYGALCTPDPFLFVNAGGSFRLRYHGQIDETRPRQGIPSTGSDLRRAIDALLSGRDVPSPQLPSMGCNIKWRTDGD